MSSLLLFLFQGQLEEAVNKTTTLEEQQAKLQDELRQARKRIVVEAKGRKALSAEGARLRSQLSNSKADLHSMAYKLDIEKVQRAMLVSCLHTSHCSPSLI